MAKASRKDLESEDRGATKSGRAGGVQSVSRALDLLDALDGRELGLVQLGRRTGLQPSTTHRMLATLAERGYVQRSATTGRYRLARRVTLLGKGMRKRELQIKSLVRPHLQRIQTVAQETVNLTILDGDEVIFISQIPKKGSPAPRLTEEARLPAHASASGKALLAFRDQRANSGYLVDRTLAPCTSHTIVDTETLATELEEIRARGFAFDKEEFIEGISCVAAPLFDQDGAAAAFSVSGPTTAISPGLQQDLGELVSAIADEASATLGYLTDTTDED